MIINAKIKSFGDRNWSGIQIGVPNEATVFKAYEFELVQFPQEGVTSIFVMQSGVDIFSHTYKANSREAIKDTFSTIFSRLCCIALEAPKVTTLAPVSAAP